MEAVPLLLAAAALLGLAAGVEVLAGRAAGGETPARATPAGATPARATPAGATPAGATPAGAIAGATATATVDAARAGAAGSGPPPAAGPAAALLSRLGLAHRLERAGMAGRISPPALVALKLAAALAGALAGAVAAPAAPGRLSLLVALGMPAAGFLGPDAWLERRARARLAAMRTALPDALDLLSVGAAAGRSPVAGMAEVGGGEGPLAAELAVLSAEASCGAPQRELLASLRSRVPVPEVAGMCGIIERSRRYGSPLAEQLREQASGVRAGQRRRTAEHAARAAPKIQLAVALLLVPSVLLIIAAALLANMDRFLAGI